jgi:hypothetical protein
VRDTILAFKLDHYVWNLDILLRLVLGSNLKDEILLVIWNRVPTHSLHEFAQPD